MMMMMMMMMMIDIYIYIYTYIKGNAGFISSTGALPKCFFPNLLAGSAPCFWFRAWGSKVQGLGFRD